MIPKQSTNYHFFFGGFRNLTVEKYSFKTLNSKTNMLSVISRHNSSLKGETWPSIMTNFKLVQRDANQDEILG